MMHLIGFIIFGLIVGLIARAVMPGRDRMSISLTAGLGIVGALIAGFLGRVLGLYGPNDGAGFIMSIVGAVIVLFTYNAVARRRGLSHTSVTEPRNRDRDYPRKSA